MCRTNVSVRLINRSNTVPPELNALCGTIFVCYKPIEKLYRAAFGVTALMLDVICYHFA